MNAVAKPFRPWRMKQPKKNELRAEIEELQTENDRLRFVEKALVDAIDEINRYHDVERRALREAYELDFAELREGMKREHDDELERIKRAALERRDAERRAHRAEERVGHIVSFALGVAVATAIVAGAGLL